MVEDAADTFDVGRVGMGSEEPLAAGVRRSPLAGHRERLDVHDLDFSYVPSSCADVFRAQPKLPYAKTVTVRSASAGAKLTEVTVIVTSFESRFTHEFGTSWNGPPRFGDCKNTW